MKKRGMNLEKATEQLLINLRKPVGSYLSTTFDLLDAQCPGWGTRVEGVASGANVTALAGHIAEIFTSKELMDIEAIYSRRVKQLLTLYVANVHSLLDGEGAKNASAK